MKITRDWATPLTIGAFCLMAVTGILMFFHWDTGLNMLAHEWLGWVMVIGVVFHGVVNWAAFKRHVLANRMGQVIVVVSLVVLLATFFAPSPKRGPNPMFLAVNAVLAAPVRDVAVLVGKSPEALVFELQKAGFEEAKEDVLLQVLTHGNHQREGHLLEILFGQNEKLGPSPELVSPKL